jgi:hypothetical protein
MSAARWRALTWLALLASLVWPGAGVMASGWSRFAVVAGNNRGLVREQALRYAEADAHRFAEVLRGPGQVPGEALRVLVGGSADQFRAAVQAQEAAVSAARAQGQRAMLILYFSGHSDGRHLQFGDDLLPFGDLRDLLDATEATLALVVVDSCQSGGLTGLKGIVPIVDVEVWLKGSADASGTVIVTSAADGEYAQESLELEGSFFTHHLVWGLRGAADFDQDDRVTLAEAYNYAYSRTVNGTWNTVTGRQHPTIELNLDQRGTVSLTDLGHRDAEVVFGAALSGTFSVIDPVGAEVLAEVRKPAGRPQRLAVSSGDYWITQRRGRRLFVQPVSVASGQRVVADPADMIDYTATIEGVRKSGLGVRRGSLQITGAYGLASGTLGKTSALHQASLGLRWDLGRLSLFPHLVYGETRGEGDPPTRNPRSFSVRGLGLETYAAWRFEISLLDLFAGLNLGASWLRQRVAHDDVRLGDETHDGLSVTVGLMGGLDLPISGGLSTQLFWELDELIYRRQGLDDLAASLAVKGTLGLAYRF